LNSIGDAVIASDRDSRVTFLNHEAERLCGWTSAEAEGHALDEVFHILHEETGSVSAIRPSVCSGTSAPPACPITPR
jgi:PAS domain S-box-containing protein